MYPSPCHLDWKDCLMNMGLQFLPAEHALLPAWSRMPRWPFCRLAASTIQLPEAHLNQINDSIKECSCVCNTWKSSHHELPLQHSSTTATTQQHAAGCCSSKPKTWRGMSYGQQSIYMPSTCDLFLIVLWFWSFSGSSTWSFDKAYHCWQHGCSV